jgi:hypothetical protein
MAGNVYGLRIALIIYAEKIGLLMVTMFNVHSAEFQR